MAGKARDWLDLSTGINPRPYPLEPVLSGLQGEDWGRLPQTDAYDNLLAAAHRYYADGSDACGDVVAAPGSEALVQLVPLLLPRSRVVVLGPCYDGHASAWRAVGHMVAEAPSLPAVTPGLVVIVVNPNNPDGRIFDVETLVHYGRSLADRGGLLVVDEAFADLAPEYSLVPRAGQCGVLVLRSFGKFFGLAGLRLGFAFGARKVVARGFAPLSAPGRFLRRRWQWERRRCAIATGSNRRGLTWSARRSALDTVLRDHHIEIVGGTDLFRLITCEDVHGVFDRLARAHILTRPFTSARDRLRIAPPGDDVGLERLDRALRGRSVDPPSRSRSHVDRATAGEDTRALPQSVRLVGCPAGDATQTAECSFLALSGGRDVANQEGRGVMFPAVLPTYARANLTFERGEGAYLFTADGRRFLDFASGIAVTALGHNHPHLVQALTEQAQRLWHVSNLFEIPGQTRAAERLVAATFADSVFFANSGAEAVECGLKAVRRYFDRNGQPERYRVITFHGSFHGPDTGHDFRRWKREIPGWLRPRSGWIRPSAVR